MEKQKRKPRRHNHEGTRIQKRDDGRYMTRVMYGYTDDGKPNYQYFYGKTIPEVQKAKKEYILFLTSITMLLTPSIRTPFLHAPIGNVPPLGATTSFSSAPTMR